MPTIYTATCSACGRTAYASDQAIALQLDDGSTVPLRHPGEAYDLEAAGFTWSRAYDEARIVHITYRVCRACGGIYQRRKRKPPMSCLSMLMFMLGFWAISAALPSIGRLSRVSGAMVAAGSILISVAAILGRLSSRAFRANRRIRPPVTDVRCCQRATRATLDRLPLFGLRTYPCPACGAKTSRVRATGRS